MAQEVEFGTGGEGKIRSFWVGFGLSIITFSIYGYCWYYFVNDELKDIGIAKGDDNLAASNPTMSVAALISNWFLLFVPGLISVFNYGKRIRRAQRLVGIEKQQQIDPTLAFLLLFPGGLLVIPAFFHYWYVTKHQNMALRAVAGLPITGEIEAGQKVALPSKAQSKVSE